MSFNILGMNVGSNEADYKFLLNKTAPQEGTLLEHLQKYENASFENKESAGQKVLIAMQEGQSLPQGMTDWQKQILAHLLFNNRLDLVEDGLPAQGMKDLIDAHQDAFKTSLKSRVSDDRGIDKFKEKYPKICENYSDLIPRKSIIGRMIDAISDFFGEEKKAVTWKGTVLDRQLSHVRDRLAVDYFQEVVARPDRPGVITLQELTEKNNQPIQAVLEDSGYVLCMSGKKSDTAIAIDLNQFYET